MIFFGESFARYFDGEGQPHFRHADWQGNVAMVTDRYGDVEQHVGYYPYGEPWRESKYLRALPLHPSQQEVVHDGFSLFYYTMQITDDLVRELLSYGSRITVVSPPELRDRIHAHLTAALANYTEK